MNLFPARLTVRSVPMPWSRATALPVQRRRPAHWRKSLYSLVVAGQSGPRALTIFGSVVVPICDAK